MLFETIRENNVRLNGDKCEFLSLIVLRWVGIFQMAALNRLKNAFLRSIFPHTKKPLRAFVGSVHYTRTTLPGLAVFLEPFT